MIHIAESLNIISGSCLILALIGVDYLRKYNTDIFQRRIFLKILIFSFVPMAIDFIYYLFGGYPGELYFRYFIISLYYIFQVLFCYYLLVFIDYSAFKDEKRSKKIIRAIWLAEVFLVILLLLNMRFHFYFYITDSGRQHGKLYFIHLFISYSPVLFAFYDIIRIFKERKDLFFMLALFIVFIGGGSSIDLLFRTESLIWPCFAAAMLYAYLFIIKADSRLDALTGLENRSAFNEFITKLGKQSRRESWAVIMIDMDHFKTINDTFGHAEGDNALRDMANIIKNNLPYPSFAARYGGDEFIVAVREGTHEELLTRIQAAMDAQNEQNIRPYQIQMSYGYGIYTANSGQAIHTFLISIDALMYKNKAERRRRGIR